MIKYLFCSLSSSVCSFGLAVYVSMGMKEVETWRVRMMKYRRCFHSDVSCVVLARRLQYASSSVHGWEESCSLRRRYFCPFFLLFPPLFLSPFFLFFFFFLSFFCSFSFFLSFFSQLSQETISLIGIQLLCLKFFFDFNTQHLVC